MTDVWRSRSHLLIDLAGAGGRTGGKAGGQRATQENDEHRDSAGSNLPLNEHASDGMCTLGTSQLGGIGRMSLAQVLETLSHHHHEFTRRFRVRSLAVFGSVARGDARPDSDVDILVSFEEPPGFDGYMALKWRIEEVLGTRVDVVMESALRPDARAVVEAEAIRVA